MAGIYIHIPFCKQACNYCDFHFSTNLKNKSELLNAIVIELKQRHAYLNNQNLNSIYFGGGTPSLLNEEDLTLLFECIQLYFNWDKKAEITLEANPDDINHEKLKTWLSLGINRLSIGLQSFNDDELKWMNRAHNSVESHNAVKLAQDAGFNNISIDLIYGSKFQDLNSWEKTLKKAIELNTQHISSYNLTIEGKTKLNNFVDKGLEPEVNEQLSSKQFELMVNMLAADGFEQYEISNFAKENYTAVHNTSYWLQQPYLGLGPSAHSYNGLTRQWNVKSNAQYIQSITTFKNYFEIENLSNHDMYNEFVLTRLRTKWGIQTNDILQKFGQDVFNHFNQAVMQYPNEIINQNNTYILNAKGKLLADKIASDLFLL